MCTDINEFNPYGLKKELDLSSGELDLLAGGPPCQSFSLIGKRRSISDDRGSLLFKMIDFAYVFQPKAILIEQVKGLLSAKGSNGVAGSVLKTVIANFEEIGYSVSYRVLRAADYGVPQLRDRVFIVGVKGNSPFQFPVPTHFNPRKRVVQKDIFSLEKYAYVSVKDAIGDLPPPAIKGEVELIDIIGNSDESASS